MSATRPARRRRFTLIEVIIVVGVLIILAAIFLPVLSKSHPPAKKVNCAGNLKQIGLSLLMYSGDFDGYFPNANPIPTNNFEPLVTHNYIQEGKVWSCPSRTQVLTLGRNAAFRYIGSGLKDDNKSATAVSLAYDQSGNHPNNEWCNVLFVDGHVEGAKPANTPNFAND